MADKLTDKEIIQALECCKSLDAGTCKSCIFGFKNRHPNSNCINELCDNALDLINRQQETIETLRNCVEQHHIIRKDGKSPLSLLKAELKSEAIKEFWEKLWELDPEIISKVVSFDLDELNNLKKEMVGEDK